MTTPPSSQESLDYQGFASPRILTPRGLTSATVSAQVDRLGTGRYQLLVLIGVGCAALSESVEMGAAAPMHSALTRAFDLSKAVREALPAFTVAGSAIGMLASGPACDYVGRKAVLLVSNVAIAVCMCGTALMPITSGAHVVLALRFMSGFSAALGAPAGVVLAVESSPHSMRARLLFAITFLSSLGYLICAIGLELFMPYLGDSEDDAWRKFYFFVAAPSILSLPFVAVLNESPCFLAVNRQPEKAVQVLCNIAATNGVRLDPDRVVLPMPPEVDISSIAALKGRVVEIMAFNTMLLVILCVVDGCRGYFVSGSAYVWKDYFAIASAQESARLSPAMMNIVASLSPLVGLVIGERFVFMGVRRVTFFSAVIACSSLCLLNVIDLSGQIWKVVGIVILVKLTYGPINTCVSLMKTEAFPTEIRATTYALISVVSKVGSAMGPMSVEYLRGEEENGRVTEGALAEFIFSLAAAVMLTGVLALAVPGSMGFEEPLEDFVFDTASDCESQPIKRQLSHLDTKSSPGGIRGYGTLGGGKSKAAPSPPFGPAIPPLSFKPQRTTFEDAGSKNDDDDAVSVSSTGSLHEGSVHEKLRR